MGDLPIFVPKEELPEACPPPEAVPLVGKFVRVIASRDYDDHFCDSHKAQNRPRRGDTSDCVYAACSLILYDETWSEGPLARVVDFAKSARLLRHNPYGAVLVLKAGDGVGIQGNEDAPHFSFWMHAEFNPKEAVIEVIDLT